MGRWSNPPELMSCNFIEIPQPDRGVIRITQDEFDAQTRGQWDKLMRNASRRGDFVVITENKDGEFCILNDKHSVSIPPVGFISMPPEDKKILEREHDFNHSLDAMRYAMKSKSTTFVDPYITPLNNPDNMELNNLLQTVSDLAKLAKERGEVISKLQIEANDERRLKVRAINEKDLAEGEIKKADSVIKYHLARLDERDKMLKHLLAQGNLKPSLKKKINDLLNQ
jgi:hypothetical protein